MRLSTLSRLFVLGMAAALSAMVAQGVSQTGKQQPAKAKTQLVEDILGVVDTDTEAATRDLIRIRQKEEETPWLRMNVAGHSADVRGLAFTPDGKRLCSAGLDKVVNVWNLAALRDLKRVYLKERTLRWQVARSLRGSVFSIAVAPNDSLLAMAGYGAMAGLGEIQLYDPVSGEYKGTLLGEKDRDGQDVSLHRQSIDSMSFSTDGQTLASSDVEGRTVIWRRGADGAWTSKQLLQPDDKQYGAALGYAIEQMPKLRPIAMAGNRVVVCVLTSKDAKATLVWMPAVYAVGADGSIKFERWLNKPHNRMIPGMAASRDGSLVATSDLEGKLYVWNVATGALLKELKPDCFPRSLAFDPAGKLLAVGAGGGVVDVKTQNGRVVDPGRRVPNQVQLWDLTEYKLLRSYTLDRAVEAVAISAVDPNGKQFLAYAGGLNSEVRVERLDNKDPAYVLQGDLRPVFKVAFARSTKNVKGEPEYRVAFGSTKKRENLNDYGDLEESYDFTGLNLNAGAPPVVADYVPTNAFAGQWRAALDPTNSKLLRLYLGQQPQGYIPYDPIMGGSPTSWTFIPGKDGQPVAIAVGTNLQNSIFVYRLTMGPGACPALRHFRGHNDTVNSLSVSPDAKFLASGSSDGMVMVWSLADFEQGREPKSRWGATVTVEGGNAVVSDIHESGPMYRKGVRKGDTIPFVRFKGTGETRIAKKPEEIVRLMTEALWSTQIQFNPARGGQQREGFQLLPAWQPMLSLFVTRDREWAVWAPEGYYEASPNGHTKFGWQINRGVKAPPSFYRADQFQKALERPDILERMLSAGSVPEAFRLAAQAPPDEPERVIIEHVALTPVIEVISPRPGQFVDTATTKVRAKVRMPNRGKMVSAKVFANGVVAPTQKLIDTKKLENATELTYEWEAPLPADQQNLIQVVVGTDAPTAAFQNVLVERDLKKVQPKEPPKLYVLSLGVNTYQDDQINALNFSVADAQSVTEMLTTQTGGLYNVAKPTMLLNEAVTRDNFKESFAKVAETLKQQVKPDDVLVLFLAGHGVVDDKSKYYYVSHDLKVKDFAAGKLESCISWSDFELLKDIPCRKLAFLDTCHSGAIQALRERGLKAAIRDFQEDVIFTVTATKGDQKAQERAEWKHGAFTKCLLEGLQGQADASKDGVVTLGEIVAYVKKAVPELTDDGQHPMAAPDELLPFISLGLTKVTKQAAVETNEKR